MELPGKRELREQILHQMDGRTSYVSDKDVYREIDKAILRSSHGGYGTLSEKEELRRQMFYSIRGFDVLEKYLGDSSISEIMVIGASRIFVEQNGKIRRIEEHFSEEGDVYRLIEQIVAPTNRMVNEACPIVDSRLPDGSRVHIVLPPVSLEGPVITIRKFLKGGMTIEKLLAFEEFPEKLTGILSALVKSRYNILISGATNSGKSSLLNALAEYIGKRERVITIEDSAELQLFHLKKEIHFFDYESDRWYLAMIPIEIQRNPVKNVKSISFEKIKQLEIKNQVKCVIYMHLSTVALGTVLAEMTAINRFSQFLNERYIDIDSLEEVDRKVCEDYLVYINTEAIGRKSYSKDLSHLRSIFVTAGKVLENEKLENLFFRDDLGKVPAKLYKVYMVIVTIRL